MAEPIDVLVVESRSTDNEAITDYLRAHAGINILGESATGVGVVELIRRLRPKVVVIHHSRNLDAFVVTESVMSSAATPIVIVASKSDDVHLRAQRASQVGATAYVQMPWPGDASFNHAKAELLNTVHAMAGIHVVTRRAKAPTLAVPAIKSRPSSRSPGIVAIGASTGGPQALCEILSALPADLPVPILVVQHQSVGFEETLNDYLSAHSQLPVSTPIHGEEMLAGSVYVAPGDAHLGCSANGNTLLSAAPAEHGLRPAVSFLFRSVREAYGAASVGILLTGMGRDGADELALLRLAGAVTIAQDKETSMIFGMPREAIEIGGATFILGITEIAPAIVRLTRHQSGT